MGFRGGDAGGLLVEHHSNLICKINECEKCAGGFEKCRENLFEKGVVSKKQMLGDCDLAHRSLCGLGCQTQVGTETLLS